MSYVNAAGNYRIDAARTEESSLLESYADTKIRASGSRQRSCAELVRGQGDLALLRVRPRLWPLTPPVTGRGKKQVEAGVAHRAEEWANGEDPQNRLFENAVVVGLANLRAPAGRARNSRNCVGIHRQSSPSERLGVHWHCGFRPAVKQSLKTSI